MRIHPEFARFDAATDAQRMSDRLGPELSRRFPGSDPSSLQITRVIPRKEHGFTIQYQVPASGGDGFFLCGHLLDAGESPSRYLAEAAEAVIHLADLGLIVPVFPFDPKLKALRRILSPAGVATLLAGVTVPTPRIDKDTIRYAVLAYRLEKRCVIRCEAEMAIGTNHLKQKAVIKAVPRSRLGSLVGAHQALIAAIRESGSSGDLTVPQILYSDENHGVYLMEEAPGLSLHALIGKSSAEAAFAGAGRALRRLHSLPVAPDRYRTCKDEIIQLDRWTARIAPMFPDVATIFATCEQKVRDRAVSTPNSWEQCPLIHGDFYDKQVLQAPLRTTILDTDNLVAGDPAQDFGNFTAHVYLRQLQYPEHGARLTALLQSFVSAYGDTDRAFKQRSVWWRAATLLRLAGLYALRPRWRDLAPALLEEVNSCTRSSLSVS